MRREPGFALELVTLEVHRDLDVALQRRASLAVADLRLGFRSVARIVHLPGVRSIWLLGPAPLPGPCICPDARSTSALTRRSRPAQSRAAIRSRTAGAIGIVAKPVSTWISAAERAPIRTVCTAGCPARTAARRHRGGCRDRRTRRANRRARVEHRSRRRRVVVGRVVVGIDQDAGVEHAAEDDAAHRRCGTARAARRRCGRAACSGRQAARSPRSACATKRESIWVLVHAAA